MPAARTGWSRRGPLLAAMRRMRHELQDVIGAGAKGEEVDDDEGKERRPDGRRIERGRRINRSQQAVYRIGLTTDLGRHPAGDDGDEARRPHRQREAMQQRPVIEAPAHAREQAEGRQQQHQHAHSDHDPEGPEHDGHRRPVLAVDRVETLQRRVPRMLQDQRRGLGNLDGEQVLARGLVGPAEQHQRRAVGIALEVAFHGHDLDGLVLQRVQPVLVAGQDLQRRHDGDHAHRHREHDARALVPALFGGLGTQQVPRADGTHDQRRRQIGTEHRMHEAVRKGRVEDDCPPVSRHELAARIDRVAGRRLHPAVGGEDPEGREEGPDRDGEGLPRNAVPCPRGSCRTA